MAVSHVLIIAGSDSSGGAGIVRDIETVAALGGQSSVAITAVSAQTHRTVQTVHYMPPELVAAQIGAALNANAIAAIKIGMVGTRESILSIAALLRQCPHIPVILDPVLVSSSGDALLEAGATDVLINELFPLATLVTPNLPELASLTKNVAAQDDIEVLRQAKLLLAGIAKRATPLALLIKGGHATGPLSSDVVIRTNAPPLWFEAPRLNADMRGTGCMLSSAIACHLAQAASLEDSVKLAKHYVFEKMAQR